MFLKKVLHKREEKMKNEHALAERKKIGISTATLLCLFLHKNNFLIMIVLADMAFSMADFVDFDNGQIS